MKTEEYEIMYRVEDNHWWYIGLRNMMKTFWSRHVAQENPRVLDIGCGTGAMLAALKADATVFGIDRSIEAIQFCRRRALTCAAVASAMELPFSAGHFDVAVTFDVIYHKSIVSKSAFLSEISRVLKPGGLLLINVPAYQWLYSSHDVSVHTDQRFTRGEIVELLRDASFEPLDVTHWNGLLLPLIVPVRLWRKCCPPAHSDLGDAPSEVANAVFGAVLRFERRLIDAFNLPCGLSIFAVARKTGGPERRE